MENDIKPFMLSEHVQMLIKNKELIKKALTSGKRVQEILEFSEDTMLKFYQTAFHLFEQKHDLEASNAFVFLVTLNPANHDYWLGLGMSIQRCGEYEAAIDAYEMAAILDVESPVPYFYLAKCLFAIHDRTSSLQALDMAIEYSGESEEYFDLKNQAIEARKLLIIDHS